MALKERMLDRIYEFSNEWKSLKLLLYDEN